MRKKNRPTPRLGLLLPSKGQRRSIELLASASVGVLVISIFLITSLDRILISSDQYASVIAAVLVDLANSDRSAENLDILALNPVLMAVAQAKADDMAQKGYFAHTSPEGVEPWHWFKQVGYSFDYAGENLAVDFSDSSDVNAAWMNSPTHRENILSPHFTEIGIATAQGIYRGRPTTFVVQEFGAPAKVAQRAVSVATVPSNPLKPALASAAPSAVLGAAKSPSANASKLVQTQTSGSDIEVLGTSVSSAKAPALDVNHTTDYAPFWAHLIASPKQMLHFAYYLLGFLVLLGLLITTGFEIHVRHIGKAALAGALIVFIGLMFVIADTFLYSAPTLAKNSAMTAAVASTL